MVEAKNLLKREEAASRKEDMLIQGPKVEIYTQTESHGKNNKRDSIKFLRKIFKIGVQQLKLASFPTAHFEYFIDALILVIKGFDIKINDTNSFVNQNKEIFRKIWSEFKGLLSFRKNPKLSLLTSEEWESFFTKKGFEQRLSQNTENFAQLMKSVTLPTQEDRWLFLSLYCKLAFILNTVLVQSIIYIELPNDGNFLGSIKPINELILLTQTPSLYKHFNHSKGKFANECCNRCKICCSATVPKNFKEILKSARENQKKIELHFKSLKTQESMIVSKEVIGHIFSFCGFFSVT